MQAASQNQLAACYMGIPVKRVHGWAWAIAGAAAAVAGILLACKGSIDPNTGFLGIKAFAAAVIGGFGSLPGALAGGLIVGLIEQFAARHIEAGYSHIAPYAVHAPRCCSSGPAASSRRFAARRSEAMRFHFKTSYDHDIPPLCGIRIGRCATPRSSCWPSRCRSCSTTS